MAIGFTQYPPVGTRIPNLQQIPDITLPASSVMQQVSFVCNGGPVVLLGLAAVSDAAFTSRLFPTWENCYLDTGPVRSTSLWGTAKSPTWVRPKFIPQGSTLNFELVNLVPGGTNLVQLTLYCANALDGDEALYGRGKGFMVYVIPNDTGMVVAANKTLQFNQRIEDWADFAPDAMVSEQTSASFEMNIDFRDTRADYVYSLLNIRAPKASLFGSPSSSGVEIEPWLFPEKCQPIYRRSSNLQYDAFDQSASSNTIRPVQIGQRLT